MEQLVTVTEIGQSIRYWCKRNPSTGTGLRICREARVLADVLGAMIFNQQQVVPASELDEEQLRALEESKGSAA
jgi:hypothetical protein